MEWFQFILDNPDKAWDYKALSANPNITWHIVQANPDKPWNYDYLSHNPMEKYKIDFVSKMRIVKRTRDLNLKDEVKRRWVEKIYHPDRINALMDSGMDNDEAWKRIDTTLGVV